MDIFYNMFQIYSPLTRGERHFSKGFYCLFLLFLTYSGIHAQLNEDYYKYGASPSVIPSFLLGEMRTEPLYFGISDPDMDSMAGVSQAVQRAEALMYLSQQSRARSFFDYYLGEEYSSGGGTFQSFVQLYRKDSILMDYSIIDTAFTRFGEAIVRIQPLNNTRDEIDALRKTYEIHFDKYRMEYEWGGALEFEDQTEFKCVWRDTIEASSALSVFKYSNQFEAISSTDSMDSYLPALRYNYVEKSPGKQQYYRCGLWVHFIDELITIIADESRKANERIKKTEEAYELNTRLNQGLASNRLNFRILKVAFTEGKVLIEADIQITTN